jgi:hypothetical protein
MVWSCCGSEIPGASHSVLLLFYNGGSVGEIALQPARRLHFTTKTPPNRLTFDTTTCFNLGGGTQDVVVAVVG